MRELARLTFLIASTGLLLFTYNNCGHYDFSSQASASSPAVNLSGFPPGEGPIGFEKTNCAIGYPYSSSTPTTSLAFNESEILAAFTPPGSGIASPGLTINIWYDDERAMVLGVRQVVVKTSSGTASTDYPVSALGSNPGSQINPQVGATALTGDQAGTDVSNCSGLSDGCARPMWPSLFVTDTTGNPGATSGDWQFGGTPVAPSGVYGTWKSAVRTVDKTVSPAAVSIRTDTDPVQNQWNLGQGIPAPAGIQSIGYGTMVSWNLSALGLKSGHAYRLQFMIHDGDQNKSGGDVGQNCVNIQVP